MAATPNPAGGAFYKPIDRNDPRIPAQDGLAPSECNPPFHHQMVYAVAMTNIGHFEQAAGRVALWSSRRGDEDITAPANKELMANQLLRYNTSKNYERKIPEEHQYLVCAHSDS